MNLASRFLSTTVGRIAPKYRTLGEWSLTYTKIIEGRPITDKTKANRRCSLARIIKGLGPEKIISSIKPHEISALITKTHKEFPQLAKRIVIESKDLFNEAMNYGWIDRNPAYSVKAPRSKVQRHRLTIDQWKKIYSWARENHPPWVHRMLILALVTGQRRSDVCKMRFSDVWDGFLHVEQDKTGSRLALPVSLRLNAINITIEDAIDDCKNYSHGSEFLLRKSNGNPPGLASMSARFEGAREAVMPNPRTGAPPSLHECRSLSERMYRQQGIDTRLLLGHKHQSMTDLYNDDRGLSAGRWQVLVLS